MKTFDLSIFFDTDQSQRLFDENFEVIQYSNRSSIGIYEYLDYGNIKSSYALGRFDNFKFTKAQLLAAMLSYFHIEDLKTKAKYFFDVSFSRCTKDQLIDIADALCYDYNELDEFLTSNFEPLYHTLKSRGYSQGDYAEIILSKEYIAYITKECGKTLDQLLPSLQDEIDHLLWDAPIYARLTIEDDQEIYLDELLKDPYTYDKNLLLSEFSRVYREKLGNDFNEVYLYLVDNLPDYLDYL